MLIKVCDKCGKVNNTRNLSEEKCKYCDGKMVIKGSQKGAKAGWELPKQ